MIRRVVVLSALLLAALTGVAAEPYDTGKSGVSEVLLRAMGDEMRRSIDRLRLGELDTPYFIAQTVVEQHVTRLEGSFGAIIRPRDYNSRALRFELRVGSREFDDTNFVPSDVRTYAPQVTFLPVEDDYDSLRFEIWSVADRAYKQALERLSKKRAYQQSRNITETVPDLSEEGEPRSPREVAAIPPIDREDWEQRLRKASAVFRDYPRIQASFVRLNWSRGHTYFIDSEGRSVVSPQHQFEIRIGATGQADDGMTQQDEVRIISSSVEGLPSTEELAARVVRVARDVTALTEAPQAGIYLGPVLLEGQAAGEFFNQLLATGVAGSRRLWTEAEWIDRYFEPGKLLDREGLRVISPLFDVYDDPTVAEVGGRALVGHFEFDRQGIPARRVDLIERGILRDVLMSRNPTEERRKSNGHGRASLREPISAGVGNLFLDASETVSASRLRRKLREEAKEFGLTHGLIIRRIADESKRGREELIAAPVLVFEIDVETGEERLVRDARFHSVTMRALRDIVAASSERHVYNLEKPGNAYFRGDTSVSIVHPSILLAEMELTETTNKPDKPPYLPHPHFGEEP